MSKKKSPVTKRQFLARLKDAAKRNPFWINDHGCIRTKYGPICCPITAAFGTTGVCAVSVGEYNGLSLRLIKKIVVAADRDIPGSSEILRSELLKAVGLK